MKKHLLLNQLFGTEGSPNQTGKTLTPSEFAERTQNSSKPRRPREVQSLYSACSAVDVPMTSYGASDEHPMSTRSASDGGRWNSRAWKYVACMLMVLFLGVGQMWGETEISFAPLENNTTKDNVTVNGTTNAKLKIANTSNQTGWKVDGSGTITISSTSFNITKVVFIGNEKSESTGTANGAGFKVSSDGSSYEFLRNGFTLTDQGGSTHYYSDPAIVNKANVATSSTVTMEFASAQRYVQIVKGSGSQTNISSIKVYTEPAYTITWANGGHGTAPTSPVAAASVMLPKLFADGYKHTGWKANQSTKVNGSSTAANTLIANGSSVLLEANTTLTAQWEEVECPDGGTIFSLSLNKVSTKKSLAAYEEVDVSTYATISKGEAVYSNTGSNAKGEVTNADPGKLQFNDNSIFLKVSVYCALQTGDVISFTDGAALAITANNSRVTTNVFNGSSQFTVTSSFLNGAHEFYIWKNSSNSTLKTLTITRPVACTSHSVNLTSSGSVTGGTFTTSSATVCEGETATLTATPAAGYEFTSWSATGTGGHSLPSTTTNPATLTMGTADVTVNATFSPVYASGTYQFDVNDELGTAPNNKTCGTGTDSNFRIDNIFFSGATWEYDDGSTSSTGDGNNYQGWKWKTKDATIKFLVEEDCDVTIGIGTIKTGGGATITYTNQSNVLQSNVALTAATDNPYKVKGGTLVTITHNNSTNTVTLKKIIISSASTCTDKFSFHSGTNSQSDWTVSCFENSEVSDGNGGTFYYVENYTIPNKPNFYVGWAGRWATTDPNYFNSEMANWSAMPIHHLHNAKSLMTVNDGNSVGAIGTLCLWSSYNNNNKYVDFIPGGYIMKIGENYDSYELKPLTSNILETVWQTDVMELTEDMIEHKAQVLFKTASGSVWCAAMSSDATVKGSMGQKSGAETWGSNLNTGDIGKSGRFRIWADNSGSNWNLHFVPYYVLSYDDNGGSGTTAATTRSVEESATVSVASNGFTAPTGKQFAGWATSEARADEGTIDYEAGADYSLTSDATLYAVWNCITPDAPTASAITATDGCGAAATFSAEIPSLPSYVTWYWQTSSGGTITSNPASTDYTTDATAGSKTIYLRAKNTVCDTWSEAATKSATVRTAVTAAWNTAPADGTVGGSMTASVTTNYSAGLRFSSSDATVASVNETSGAISYLKAGTTTITATVTGADSYCSTASVNKLITVSAAAFVASTSVNIEQGVLDHGKSWDYASALTSAKITTNGTGFSLDSLDDSSDKSGNYKKFRNYPYLGLKIKNGGSYVSVNLPKDKALNVKFGYIKDSVKVFIDDTEITPSPIKSNTSKESKTYTLSSSGSNRTVKFQTPNGDAVVIKQIMVGESLESITLPAKITLGATTDGTISVDNTKVDVGSTVAITVTPSSGYELDELTVTRDTIGSPSVSVTNNEFTMPNNNVTINATFVAAPSCSAPTSPEIDGETSYTAGEDIELTASATGTSASTTYQWYKGDPENGGVSQGAASTGGATLTIEDCSTSDAGTYYCVISNGTGCTVTTSQAITVSAAPSASCITWEGTPSSWTGDASPWTMTVSTKLVLKAVGNKWSINSSTNYIKYAGVWQENSADHIETVIAIDDHAVGKYLQGSFADGSVIKSLTIGAANNSGTAGTNNNYVVMFSATENFATVLADGSGNKAQVVSAPSYKDTYNASNLEKSITVPTGAKFFRIYRKIVGAGDSPWTIGDWIVPSDMGSSAKFRIFKIEACPEGSDCTNPTIEWDNTPADGLVGGTMTASVTSNYPAGVTYRSSDATVASVDASTGVIRYLKAGSATITATVEGDGTTYCDLTPDPSVSQAITVTAVATGITVTPSTIDVQVGGTEDLTATLTPAGAADETVTWTSEYTANATVALADEDEDKAAVVTGVALRPTGTSFKIYAKTSRLTANSWYATVRVYKGVTYDATTNGGSCATASAKYYGDAALVLPAATKTDNTFTGWYTASSGGSKVGDAGDEYTPTANSTTLYAQFTANVPTYAITYELNGGTHGTTYSATGTPNTAHELSAPTRSGYTFTGWSVSPVVSGATWGTTSSPTTDITDASTLAENGTSSVWFKDLAAANGAVTITAHWTQDCAGGGSTTLYSFTVNNTGSDVTVERSGGSVSLTTSNTFSSLSGGTATAVNINTSSGGPDKMVGTDNSERHIRFTSAQYQYVTIAMSQSLAKGDVIAFTGNGSAQIYITTSSTWSNLISTTSNSYTIPESSSLIGVSTIYIWGTSTSTKIKTFTVTRPGSAGGTCYHVIYHANGAERGAVEDAARYVEGATVTVKDNGFTKAGETFRGWATSQDNATAGTVAYDPDDSFTMGTADVELWAVWGTAAPRVYSLTGSAYRCTSDEASTITLAGSETGVEYQLKKDGEADGDPVTGTGSALTWSKTAWGTYTVEATRSTVSSMMSGEVVLSDYPLTVTENLNGGTVAQDGAFTLSAKVSVHADNSASYTYQWFSNDAANYDTPLSLGSATAMAASTGTQQFDYNPSTAEGGTMYYFCEFKSPCNTIVRTRVVSVKVTTATTTLTWDRDGAGDDFEDLPQGGKHTITVSSNSGVAPSLEVAGTDVELTDVEQNAGTATTTATLVLGASAADVVLTAEVSANGDYAEKSEDKEVIVKECSADETVLYEMHLTNYNAYSVNSTYGGSASIGSFSSTGSTFIDIDDDIYYQPSGNIVTATLAAGKTLQAGDKIILKMTCKGTKKTVGYDICKSPSNSTTLVSVTTTMNEGTAYELEHTISALETDLVNKSSILVKRNGSDVRFYGMSIVRGGGSGSAADVASGIAWITNPDLTITRSTSNDPFTYAVRATTPSMGTITYTSSNEDVATVDANGRVTIKATGETTISAQQEAIGCYMESDELSYSLTVESCTGEKEPVITYDGTVICPDGSKTLTATNYEEGATIQWYKDGVEISEATSETYNATAAGTYTVVAHKDCYSESSNSVTLTKMSAEVDVKTYADEFTIKSKRPYNFRLFEIEDGATMTVQSRTGIEDANSVVTQSGNTITISGTAPTIDAIGDATVVIRISRTGCSGSYVDTTVTIHKIPATAKPTIAWIATGTKGDKENVVADESNNVDLYQELENHYTVTARNCYWTTSEAELVKEYSQYDLIVLTDYPNSQTAPSGKGAGKSYTNAIGLLKDHIPMLTFEAYVAQCPNWEIPSNPHNTSNTQNDITLLCNADEIFGTSGKFGAGSAISVATVASGQALQGFLPTDAPFVFIGSITDDATTYIACCERQVNPAARMMIFGLNANTMNNLTSDGKEMVRGFINYLLISDAASIPDCSVIFNGGAGPADQNWNTTANWEGGTLPGKYASVRIDKPCVVSGDYVAEAGYLKIHTSTNESTYPYTGKLTIASDGVMAIDGTITRVEDNRYTLHLPTRPEDLIIESDASGQGALIFDNDEGTTQARVEMYTKAYYDGAKDHWQYVAVPLTTAGRWSLGSWTYQHDNVAGSWDYYVDNFSAFEAVAVAQDDPTTYVFEGALASTKTQKISMPATNAIEGTSLIGNSWTAPIQIVNFEEEDFGGAKASVFIYETGYDPDGGAQDASGNAAAGERAAGYWYEIPVFGTGTLVSAGAWEGMKVIPAMQAFEIKNKTGANTTLTLDYDRLVRTATNDMNEARRAPRRMKASNEIATLRVTMSDGEIRNDVYLISGEQFSEGFDNGWDGEYVGGKNCSQLYALSPVGNLSMSAQPEMEGTILGFAAGTKTEFTITFHYTGDEELYLNDMETHQSTLISGENEYLFTAESGEKGDRFEIGEQLFGAPGIATGVTDLDAEATEAQKIIYNDKLYIIRGGKVYSAEGQLVK